MKLGRELTSGTKKGSLDEAWAFVRGAAKDPLGDVAFSIDLHRFSDIQNATKVMRQRARLLMKAARSQGFTTVKGNWRWLRLNVSLQFRLFAEQVFWVMGKPWSSLITGFKPIE